MSSFRGDPPGGSSSKSKTPKKIELKCRSSAPGVYDPEKHCVKCLKTGGSSGQMKLTSTDLQRMVELR